MQTLCYNIESGFLLAGDLKNKNSSIQNVTDPTERRAETHTQASLMPLNGLFSSIWRIKLRCYISTGRLRQRIHQSYVYHLGASPVAETNASTYRGRLKIHLPVIFLSLSTPMPQTAEGWILDITCCISEQNPHSPVILIQICLLEPSRHPHPGMGLCPQAQVCRTRGVMQACWYTSSIGSVLSLIQLYGRLLCQASLSGI